MPQLLGQHGVRGLVRNVDPEAQTQLTVTETSETSFLLKHRAHSDIFIQNLRPHHRVCGIFFLLP
jgi:hypothetical protein